MTEPKSTRPKTAAASSLKPVLAQAQRLVRPDFVRRDWCFTMPAGVTQEQLLAPAYWRSVSHQLSRGDLIEVRDDFLTRFAKLWVVAVDRPVGHVEVRLLQWYEVDPSTPAGDAHSGFTPHDAGVHEGWTIIRDSDGQVMRKNMTSFHEAMRVIRTELAQASERATNLN